MQYPWSTEKDGWIRNNEHFAIGLGILWQWTYFRWKIAKVGSMAYVLKSPGTIMYCIAPTVWTVELDLLAERNLNSVLLQGAPTWLSQGLQIEEAMIILRRDTKVVDRLSSSIQKFLSDAPQFLGDALIDVENEAEDSDVESADGDEVVEDSSIPPIPLLTLPLPSTLGHAACVEYGIGDLAHQELSLRMGQANDALHAIHLALVDKAILFHNDVCHASGNVSRSCAWGKVKSVDTVLCKYTTIYKKSDGDHWMSEFYCVNWLRGKVVWDCWAEELELTSCEFQWTVMFFQMKSDSWVELQHASLHSAQLGHASYAARQATLYHRLRDQCEQMWMKAISTEPSQQMGL
ncbi:hypothetical protein JVU11DRAFT_10845 [Chiua virens]|nr:hypothetical protein JVU11DRAFT_10845 [Chiua virens]